MVTNSEHSKKIGNNLRKIRLQKGFMQIDVAVATNLDRTYISKIENGKARITAALLLQLANGLELTSLDLIEGQIQSDTFDNSKGMEVKARKYLKWVDAPIWVKSSAFSLDSIFVVR